MKKIFTLITVCLLAQASFAQNIINISAPGLNCAGDQTTITVETDYTNPIPNLPTGLTYNLLSSNSILGPWSPWPGQQNQPFTTAIFDIVNIQSSHWMVEIMDAALVITDFEIISITSIPSFDFVPAFPATVNDIGCNGDNDGSIELWLQGGTWPYDFNWVGPAGYVNNQLNTNPSNISGLAAGTYTCIAIDDNGCSFDGGPIQYTIIDPPALDVSNTSTSLYNGGVNVSCFGEDDGTATVTPIGGTPFTVGAAYTYLWNDPNNQTDPTAINLTAGTYTCTVTDNEGCTATTADIILTEPAALNATVQLSEYNGVNVSCFNGADGTADLIGQVSGGTGPYSYDWRDNAGLQIAISISVAGLSAGNYTVTITDQNTCTFPIAFTMTQPATAVSAVALVTSSYFGAEVSCFGSSDGEATASGVLASGTPFTTGNPYTYMWTPINQATAIATGLSANILYTVVVTDANNCSDNASVTLTQPTTVDTISTSSTLTNCNGDYNGSATVTPTGGTAPYGYVWDDISTQTIATAVGLNAGTYNCQLTDVNGCPFNNNPLIDVTVVVSEPAPITLFPTLNNVNCFGGSDGDATVSVTGGTPDLAGNYNYLWSSGHTTATASGLSETSISGPYLCTVTDDNGCTESIFIDISEPPSLPTAVTTSTMVSCFGGSDGEATVVATGGFPGYTYIWRDPSNAIISTSQNPTGLSEGSYECTVTDVNGCPFVISEYVAQPGTDLINSSTIITHVSCNAGSDGGAQVSGSGGAGSYTYEWQGPFPSTAVISTVNNIVAQVAGQYLCYITDAAGCVVDETVDITEPPVIGFSLPVQTINPSCVGFTDGSGTVVPTGGVGGFTYQWDDPLFQTTATATGLDAGSYTCVVTDANLCSPASAVISVTLTDPSPIIFVVSPHINVMCTGDASGSLDLIVSGGTQHTLPATPYDYSWSNGTTTSLNSSLVANTYDCWIEDANGCIINTGPIQITEPAIALGASITSQVDESCYMLADGQLTCTPDLNSGTGTGTYSYLWSHGAAGNTASNLSAGPYYCTVSDANGCSVNTPTVNIIAATQLTVTPNWNPPSCNSTTTTGITNDGTATVTPSGGTGNYFYAWDDVPLFQITPTASNLITGTYNCLITDGNGCVYPEQVVVPEPTPNITATFTTTDVNCFQGTNGSITINALGGTPPLNYDWIPTLETTTTIQNLAAGIYSCNVSDIPGCTTVFSTTITENPPLVAPISVTQMSVMGANDGSMFVTVSGGTGLGTYTYNWVDANTNTVGGNSSSINSLPVGTYTCTVTDLNGCTLEVTGVIDPLSCSVTVVDNISTIPCFGGTATVSWVNSGGLAPYTNTLIDPTGVPVDLFAIYGTNQFDNNLPTPLNLTAGVYLLTVTDANGCHGNLSAAIHLNVLEPAELEFFPLTTTTDVLCYGDPTGTVNATVIGGTFAAPPTWVVTPSSGPPQVNAAALYTGNYVVTAIDDNGCMISEPFTINEPVAPLSLIASSTFEGCMPNTNGTATVTPAGGTPDLSGNYFYNWSPQNTQTISSLVAGTYTCIVTDDNGCTATISENVLNAPALNVTITATNPTCEGSNDGSIITSTTSTSLPINYVWENQANPGFQISANTSINTLDEGVYTLVPTDAYGCTQTIPAIVLTDPAAITYTLTVTNPTLNGACDGSVTVTNTVGGDGNYSFEWIGPGGYNTTPLAPGDIFSLCEGLYQLTVTDGMGCTGVQNIQVIDPACNITVTPLLTQPACAGNVGSLTWNISGGIAPYYTIVEEYGTGIIHYSGFVTPPTVPVNLPDGNYFMTVYDNMGTGCPAQINNITVTEPLPLTPTVLTNSVNCNGGSTGQATAVVVGGTPPYVNYSWSSNPLNNSPVNSLQAAGPSTLVVTDANGCISATISYTIYEPNPLIISTPMIFTEPTCNSGGDATAMATITGGTAPYTYLWSPSGDETNPAIGLAPSIGIFAGVQTLLVTDNNGCLVSDNITITQPAPITAVFTATDVLCYNGNSGSISITPSGGTGGYGYQWSPGGATTPFITGLTAGTYTCTVTDATGLCSNTFSKTITEGNQIFPNLSSTDADCFGVNNGSASVSPSGGTGVLDIMWWDLTTTTLVQNIIPATGVYWVQITDNNNPTCYELVQFDILQPAVISASATSQATSCNAGSNGQITVTASGGTAPYTYTLYDSSMPPNVVGVNGTGIFPGLSAGTYTCDIDDGFCPVQTSIVTATVLEPSPIVLNETITPITCFGGNDGTATVAPTGENDNFTISWSHFLPPGFTNGGLSGLIYTVYVTPTNGCGVQPFNIDMSLYESSLIDLTSITPSFYDYDLDGVGTEVECYGNSDGSINLVPTGGAGGYTFLWTDANGQTIANPTGLIADTYNVDVTDASGCLVTTSIILTEPAQILPTFTPTDVSCNGLTDGSIALSTPISGITATNFEYFLNATNYGAIQNIGSLPPNTYTVEVLNTMTGCSSGIQSITINDPTPLTAVSASTAVSCNGLSDGTATVISTGGTLPITYSWENDLFPGVVVSTSATALALMAGDYTCIITDAMFCTTTATANVNEPTIILPNFTYVAVTCNGLSDGQVTATPTGGNGGPYTYSWSNDPLNILNTSSGLAAVSTPYPTLIVYDIDGCPSTAENIIITEPALFTISASVSSSYNGADISCFGSSDGEIIILPLGGVGGEQYDLGLGGALTASSTIPNLSAATYFIDGYDANLCTASTTVTVTSPVALNTDLTIQNVSCLGANDGIISFPNTTGGTVTIPGIYNYTWNVPSVSLTYNLNTTDPLYPLSPFAVGTVTVSDDNGCTVVESVSITEPTAISASTSFTEPICNGDANATVTIVASGGTSPFTYSWEDAGVVISTNDMVTGLTAGTYICTYTDINGCSADITEVITEPAALDAGLVVTPISCLGLIDGTATVTPTGSSGPYSISWSNDIMNTSNTSTGLDEFDPLNMITVTVTDGIGCGSVTNTVVVLTPTSPLTVNLVNTVEPTCNGDADGQFEMSASGGTNPYYYQWPDYGGSATTNVYSPNLEAGIWTCDLTDANGCQTTIDVTMGEPAPIVPNITPISSTLSSFNSFDIQCNGGDNGEIIATPSGGNGASYNYEWTDDLNAIIDITDNPTGLSAGTYDLTVTDPFGCIGTESFTLIEPDAVTFSFVTSDFNGYDVSCSGGNDGTISVTFSGGAIGPNMATFTWTSAVMPSTTSTSITNLSAANYICEVEDMNGCFYTDNITLNEPTLITLTETSTPTTCNGDIDGTATVTATGGVINTYSYDWGALAANQTNATATALAGSTTGVTYNVIVMDANGCTDNINSTIYSPDLIVTTFSTQVNVTCFEGSDGSLSGISTTGGNGTLYNYSTDGGVTFTPALPIYNGLSQGTFSIIAQDNQGCLSTSDVTITEPNYIDPILTQQNSVTCNGINDGEIIATPTGGNNTYTYQWSNGVSGGNDVIDNLSAGTYSVIVTDGNGCLGHDTLTLFPSNNLEIIFDISDATVSCNGGSDGIVVAALNGGGLATSWLWNDPSFQTVPTASALAAGWYTCTITDANGCVVTDSVQVIEPATNLEIVANSSDLKCYNNDSGSANVVVTSPGQGNPSYVWNTIPITSVISTANSISSLSVGSYQVAVTDAGGCIQYDTVIVDQPDSLYAILTANDISCNGIADGSISINTFGGTLPYIHTWTGPGAYITVNTNITALEEGLYNLTLQDSNGCNFTDNININEPGVIDVIPTVSNNNGFGVSCFGSSDGEITAIISGGIAPFVVQYGSLFPTTQIADTFVTFSSLSGSAEDLTITDANGCEHTTNISITQPNLLEIVSYVVTNPTCYGINDGSATINVTGGVAPYSFVDANLSPFDTSSIGPGPPTVFVLDLNGCSASVNLIIEEPDEIEIYNVQCLNSISIEVQNALGDFEIIWTDESGSFIGSDLEINDLTSQMYTVKVLDQPFGCMQTDSFSIELPVIDVIDASCSSSSDGSIEISDLGTSFYDIFINESLVAEGVITSFNDGLEVGEYTISIVDEGNCEYNTTAFVGYVGGIECVDPQIIISPNYDGTNDTWIPTIDVNVDIYVTIYNRWGEVEFFTETNSLTFEWDGTTTNGEQLPSTDYYFVIDFIEQNSMLDKTGVITLIR